MTLSLYSLSTVIVMVHSIVLLLIFGAVVPCCICAPSVRGNYTELFRGYDLKQRIAYRIGQVECLKSLQEKDAPLRALGASIVETTAEMYQDLPSSNA